MTGIDSWSITPATNATCDGGAVNWAEGQPPSSVNNSSRQVLADTRAAFNDLAWFQYGTGDQGAGNIAVPAVYASGTSFTIAGADVSAAYHVGRRLRAVGSGTGTIYGSISVTSYSPTTTTVTAVWDSGSLSNETLVISLSQIPVTGSPVGQMGGLKLTGSLTSLANVVGTIIFTANGTQSVLNATATTLFSVATITAATYLVTCGFGVSDTANYSTISLVTVDATSRRIVALQTAGNATLTLSGANVQATQTSGSTQTANWAYVRIQ